MNESKIEKKETMNMERKKELVKGKNVGKNE